MDLPFRVSKIGLKNTLLIFGRKMVFCFVCRNTLSDFGLIFLKARELFLKYRPKSSWDDAVMYLNSTMDFSQFKNSNLP